MNESGKHESAKQGRENQVLLWTMTDDVSDANSTFAKVSWIIGTWTGTGKGIFPCIGDNEFSYSEQSTFYPVFGRSAIMYTQVLSRKSLRIRARTLRYFRVHYFVCNTIATEHLLRKVRICCALINLL